MKDTETLDAFLSTIYRDQSNDSSPVVRLFLMAMSHPVVTWSALRYIAEIPIVRVAIPKKERSKIRWLYNAWRPWRFNGFVSSYIELPSPLELYWRGTPKQNLRTRISQARAAGLTVRSVAGAEMNEVISQVFADKGWRTHKIEEDLRKRALRNMNDSLEDAICVGVFDQNNRAVGFCVGIQAGNAVLCLWSITSQRGAVRWLGFSGFVEEASARGARFIIEEPPWAFTGGNKIFSGHLGFTPARIRSV